MRIPRQQHGALLLVLCLSWSLHSVAAFHPTLLLLPRRLAQRPASSSSPTPFRLSSSSIVATARTSEQSQTTAEKPLPVPIAVPPIPEVSTKPVSPSKEAGMSSVAALAMWEVIRELGQRQVVFNVLQPREELNDLLFQARQGKSGGARSGSSSSTSSSSSSSATSRAPVSAPPVLDKKGKKGEETGLHGREIKGIVAQPKTTDVLPPSSVLLSSPPPPPAAAAAAAKPSSSPPPLKKQSPPPPPSNQPTKTKGSRFRPPPALAAATLPVFTSIADALAWAGKLSKEEILVELDFLHIEEGGEEGREGSTHTELARVLARAVLVEGAKEGGTEGGVAAKASTTDVEKTKATGTTTTAAAAAAAAAAGPNNKEEVIDPLPSLVMNAKSKARQRRLLEQQQQQLQLQQKGGVEGVVAQEEEGREEGREDHVLDLDHAREELVALRSRALEAAASLDSTGSSSSSSSSKGATRKRAPSSSSSFSAGSRQPPPPPTKRKNTNKRSAQTASSLFNDAYDQAKFSEGGDLALRVFEKVSRGADKALDWATRAKGMARGALITASLHEDDTDPSRKKKNGKAAELQQKSKKLLGPRGRRWSKLTGYMARAWAESAWQVVMASASWAGGGLLPGKYVLLGAGVFALLLRQGVGTYCAALLVVRTCSSTLRNMIEDEEEEVEEGEGGRERGVRMGL